MADVYYTPSFQKFLADNHLAHPVHAWAVNFRRMAEVAFTDKDSLSRGSLRVDGKKIVVKSADAQWVKDIEKTLTLSIIDGDSTFYHVIELVTILDSRDASPRHPIFRRLITIFRSGFEGTSEIPRADALDKNVEDIFANGVEAIVAERISSRAKTIDILETTIATLTETMTSTSRRHAATIEAMTLENASIIAGLESRMKSLRTEVNTLEKKLMMATRVHRDRARLSGWYVHQLPTNTQEMMSAIFRGGQLSSTDASHFIGDDMYYVTNDADQRFEEYYTSIIPTLPECCSIDDREISVIVPIRRGTSSQGVIIRLSESSYMMTHAPKLMMKATVEN